MDGAAAVGSQPGGEIAALHGVAGRGGQSAGRRRRDTGSLIREEKESSIAAVVEMGNVYRPSERSAELVSFQGVSSGEEVGGVQVIISEELEQRPMYLVRARARNHVHHTAHAAAVLRIERAGLNAELLHGVRIRKGQRDVRVRIVVVGVVQDVIRPVSARAVDGDADVVETSRRWCCSGWSIRLLRYRQCRRSA